MVIKGITYEHHEFEDQAEHQILLRERNKTSSEKILSHVLNRLSHLDLSDKVSVDKYILPAQGGYADVFKGYCSTLNRTVAVKRLRLHVGANWDVVKVSIPQRKLQL